MTPHGPDNPAEVDPADYPERNLFIGTDPLAETVIAWFDQPDPLPLPDHLAETIDATFLAGGHVLVLCRTPDALARVSAAVALIAAPYLQDGQGEPAQPELVN